MTKPNSTTQGSEDSQAHSAELRAQERSAAGELQLGLGVVPMMVATIGLLASFFLPHSGYVLGFDVLFDTDVARQYFTTTPERIYTVLVVLGILLAVATLFTRTTIVAFVTWAVACVQTVYAIFAGWMRQSRPQELPGEGISWGLVLGIACSFLLAATMSVVAFRRTEKQRQLALQRREVNETDPVLRTQQAYLGSGLTPHTVTDVAMVDDRRARAQARNQRAQRSRGETPEQ